MAHTIYASFHDRSQAVKAAGALLDHGVKNDDLSLISHGTEDELTHHTGDMTSAGLGEDASTRDVTGAGMGTTPLGTTDTGYTAGTSDIAGAGPLGTGDSTTMGSSSLGNTDLGATGATGRDIDRDAVRRTGDPTPEFSVDDDPDDAESAAKHGISVTSGEDAAVGAAKGAGWGLAVGAVAALASLFVPGVGIVVGAGALATALGGAALATGAGAIAGGVHGYLVDQGVPEDVVAQYNAVVEAGGALIEVRLPSGDVDQAEAEDILAKYGATNVGTYGARTM